MKESTPPFPINLVQLHFVRSVVIAMPGYVRVEGEQQPAPVNKLNVTKAAVQSDTYQVEMLTVVNPEMDNIAPYHIEMSCIATLVVDQGLQEEEALRGVTITAHSILYGAIRESVSWITGRQPYGPYLLGISVLTPPQSAPSPEKTN